MPRFHDTIVALATPQGISAVALVRVSGPVTAPLAFALFGDGLAVRAPHHGDYVDVGGGLVDDVLATLFKAPRSYTGEDSLEISCHGNPYIAQRILEDLCARGCRQAEPGEFTQRAFLNGRMDLSQAEAVMDLIHARSERALAAAQQQMRGALGRRMGVLIDALLSALARVEAYIDFPEEDLPVEDRNRVSEAVRDCQKMTNDLLATTHYGELLREGIKTVIVGEPNAGKSSLLNVLVGRDRAIVSPEPGTTRDFIEECIQLGPHLLRLIDTAGLNPHPQAIEKLGMEKTLERAAEADLILVVLDRSRPPLPFPEILAGRLTPKNAIIILNKSDLDDNSPALPEAWSEIPRVELSALHGEGVEALKQCLMGLADGFQVTTGNELIAINSRHARALERVRSGLAAALDKLANRGPVELLASDLREALEAGGEIAGRVDNERMLDQLFATFCIGK